MKKLFFLFLFMNFSFLFSAESTDTYTKAAEIVANKDIILSFLLRRAEEKIVEVEPSKDQKKSAGIKRARSDFSGLTPKEAKYKALKEGKSKKEALRIYNRVWYQCLPPEAKRSKIKRENFRYANLTPQQQADRREYKKDWQLKQKKKECCKKKI